jgi:hypothetical protein
MAISLVVVCIARIYFKSSPTSVLSINHGIIEILVLCLRHVINILVHVLVGIEHLLSFPSLLKVSKLPTNHPASVITLLNSIINININYILQKY